MMNSYNTNVPIYIIAVFVSFLFVFLWALFFFFFSPRNTTSSQVLAMSFGAGIGIAFFAFLIERGLLYYIPLDSAFLDAAFMVNGFRDLLHPLLFSFLIAGVVEEVVKFFVIKIFIDKSEEINQVVDGMKIGLWVGLGFAFIENIFYFSRIYSELHTFGTLGLLLALRGILSTLAHSLYGIIVGYYCSLAKFQKMYRHHFLRNAFFAAVIAHGTFNFFLLIDLGSYSVIMLAVFLSMVLLWSNDRKNLELYLSFKGFFLVFPPFLAERIEMEGLLSKKNAPADAFERILHLTVDKPGPLSEDAKSID